MDERPPSGTDNLKSGTAGQQESFDKADLAVEIAAIRGVKVQAAALKGSTSPPTTLKLGLKLGGTRYMSDALTLGMTQGAVGKVWEKSPDTGDWLTPAEYNGGTIETESVA